MDSRWIALLLFALAALVPLRASACSLVSLTPAELAKNADAIFEGRVLSFEEPGMLAFGEAHYLSTARFQVTTVWKGPTRTELEVKTARDGSACGINFTPGEYIVFATLAKDGSLRASSMGGTEVLSYSEKNLTYLKEHFTAIDMTKAPATSSSSCASAPGSAWLPSLVLLALWLRRRLSA